MASLRNTSAGEARSLETGEDGRRTLSPAAGAIRIDDALLRTASTGRRSGLSRSASSGIGA
jgi:hypothetical protein